MREQRMFALTMQTKEKDVSRKIIVRRIKTRDFTSILQVLNKAFQKEIVIIGLDSSRLLSFKKYHVLIEMFYPVFDFFHKDYPIILVAALENKVVGEVHLTPVGKRIWTIDSLAVDPGYSGRGIGYHLIKGSAEYIMTKRGKRALSSIRTDNVHALKIAEKLGFLPFQKTSLFFHEIKAPPNARLLSGLVIRGFQPTDAEEVFKVCKVADPTKTQAYNMSPKDFLTSPLEWVLNRMLQLRSEKIVIKVGGKIVGYAHISYTSQHEAAKIENFCFLPQPDFPRLAEALLIYTLNFLAERNIKKVLVNLDEKRKETIETIKQNGFQPLASFYEITKKLN